MVNNWCDNIARIDHGLKRYCEKRKQKNLPLFKNFMFTPMHTGNFRCSVLKTLLETSLLSKELVIQVSQNHSCTVLSKIICWLFACHWNLNPKIRHTTLAAPKALHTVKQSSLFHQDRQLSRGKRQQGREKRIKIKTKVRSPKPLN